MRRSIKLLSWVAGLGGLAAVVWYYGPENIPEMMRSVGPAGVAGWMVATVVARVIQAETTLVPLRALGFSMKRSVAFWVGWLRTFANQIFPAAGVIAYTQALRRKLDISWSELASLASPQFVLLAAGLGFVGLIATLANPQILGQSKYVLLLLYSGVLAGALVVTYAAPTFAKVLPEEIADRISETSEALRRFLRQPRLIVLVIGCHIAVILLRGLRMWILFAAGGVALEWNEILLVVAVAESSALVQLTPGGLGLREGAVLAGALLLGVPTEAAAGVALIDRLFIIAITVLLTPPALLALRSGATDD
jgi:uncharacterized membrane protein YbhN (UPF0104 family)